jgi:hypothetical protein
MSTGNWSFNQPLHYCGWRVFYSTTLHKKEAEVCSLNRGRNVEVVGYPNSDNFLFKEHKDVWKMQKERKKRLIWAPHFSIVPGGNLEQSNFLWMADIMLELAQSYKDNGQTELGPPVVGLHKWIYKRNLSSARTHYPEISHETILPEDYLQENLYILLIKSLPYNY